jgi:FSR family fosmidomycin resistance protein-like MFS transporter
MVSSLMMGFAFGTGGLLTPLTGILMDHFGIVSVLMAVSCIPLLTILLIRRLPEAA